MKPIFHLGGSSWSERLVLDLAPAPAPDLALAPTPSLHGERKQTKSKSDPAAFDILPALPPCGLIQGTTLRENL
jgi:hypothetical protein